MYPYLYSYLPVLSCDVVFFLNDTATTEIYTYCHTLSRPDALPIWWQRSIGGGAAVCPAIRCRPAPPRKQRTTMSDFLFRPRRIPRTGDDSPAGSLFRYLWRMSGRHQLWICLLAIVVAALTAVPLELQRRLVDEVIKDREKALLWTLGGGYD